MKNTDIEKRMAILKDKIQKTGALVRKNAELVDKLNVKSGEIVRMRNNRKK